MRTIKNLLLVCVAFMLCFNACTKDPFPTVPNNLKSKVVFTPQFYGEVVPWLAKANGGAKGFTDFTHKYLCHVIRIYTQADVFVADIPFPLNEEFIEITLPVGSYYAQFLPIMEDAEHLTFGEPTTQALNAIDLVGGLGSYPIEKAGICTGANVPFSVEEASITDAVLPCVNIFGCLQFQIEDGIDYVTAGVPVPEVWRVFNPGFLTTHNFASQEGATFAQLSALINQTDRQGWGANRIGEILDPGIDGIGTTETGGFWYDATAHIYYMYIVPGSTTDVTISDGYGLLQTISPTWATYFAYDLTGGTGSEMRTLWLKDYYTTATWRNNMTLRFTFNEGGHITVQQQDWFGTIITGGDL
jgi:hypothetical protein